MFIPNHYFVESYTFVNNCIFVTHWSTFLSPKNSAVHCNLLMACSGKFKLILFSLCRYSTATGSFTVPPGGEGIYYFSTFVTVNYGEYGRFEIHLNDDVICSMFPDQSNNGESDRAPGSCSAVMDVVAGKKEQVNSWSRILKFQLVNYNYYIHWSYTILITDDVVKVVYDLGSDNTPLAESTTDLYNGFNGFRI